MRHFISIFCLLCVGLSGCSLFQPRTNASAQQDAEIQKQLQESKARAAILEKQVTALKTQVKQQQTAPKPAAPQTPARVAPAQTRTASIARAQSPAENPDFPPNAKPGECYTRVTVPAQYTTARKKVVKTPMHQVENITPAEYTWKEQRILVKPATEVISKVIPAEYKTVKEKVLIRPQTFEIKRKPATYKTITEKRLVREAYTTWKNGRGPIEKIDSSTGEILCLVEVPAEYETITRKVLETPEQEERVAIPAEYKTVTKTVLVRPASVQKKTVPAEYKTIKVKTQVSPEKVSKKTIPAEYEWQEYKEVKTPSRIAWQSILCETNTTADVIKRLQQALANQGYDPVKIDGKLGAMTHKAIANYQKDHNLARGGITMETLQRLNVKP